MPAFNIPMESVVAPLNTNAPAEGVTAGHINTQTPLQTESRLPLSVTPFKPIDMAAAAGKAAEETEALEQIRQANQKKQDRQIMQQYLQSGGDLATPDGLQKAATELKGKLSIEGYSRLSDLADKKKLGDIKLKEQFAKLDVEALKVMAAKTEEGLRLISGPLSTYEEAVKKGANPQQALQAFEASKQAVLDLLAKEVGPDGKPMYPPEKVQAFAKMNPEQLRQQINSSKFLQDRMLTAAKIKTEEARGRKFEAQADNEENYGDLKGNGKLTEARRALRDGDITQEQYDEIVKNITAGTAGKGGATKDPLVGNDIYEETKTGKRFLVNKRSGQAWELSADGAKTEIPLGQVPKDVVRMGSKAAGAGARESVFTQRVLLSANEAARDLENVIALPTTSSSGIFGGRKQGPGIMAATKEMLTNNITSEEVQMYNTMATGFQRSLATIESAGLMPSGSLTHQMDTIIFKEGDTNASKMSKLAQVRQIVEAGLEVMLENPRISAEEKAKAKEIVQKLEKAVPFTQKDVIKLRGIQEEKPDMTMEQLLNQGKKQLDKEARKAGTKQPATPADFPKVEPAVQKNRDSDTVQILQDELKAEKKLFAEAKTPEDKHRAEENIKSLNNEIAKKGGKTETAPAGKKKAISLDEYLTSKGY